MPRVSCLNDENSEKFFFEKKKNCYSKFLGFRDLVGTGIAPVSKKNAGKY